MSVNIPQVKSAPLWRTTDDSNNPNHDSMKHIQMTHLHLGRHRKTIPRVTKQLLVQAFKVSWVNLESITWLRPGGRALAGGEGGARSRARSWLQIRSAGDRRGQKRRERAGCVCVCVPACLPACLSLSALSFLLCLSLSISLLSLPDKTRLTEFQRSNEHG